MTVVLVVLAVVALGVAALLFVPVRARLEFDSGAARRLTWRVRWLMLAFGGDRPARERRPRKGRERRPRRSRERSAGGTARAVLVTPGFVPRGLRLLRQLVTAVRPQEMDASVRIGLEDPAATGMLFGQIMALSTAVPALSRVSIEADFEEPGVQGCGMVAWSVPPARVLWPVATFMVAPPVWRAAWAAWKAPAKRSDNR